MDQLVDPVSEYSVLPDAPQVNVYAAEKSGIDDINKKTLDFTDSIK